MNAENRDLQKKLDEEYVLKTAAVAYDDYIEQEFETIRNDPSLPDLPEEQARRIDASAAEKLRHLRRKEKQRKWRRWCICTAACILILLIAAPAVAMNVVAVRSQLASFMITNFDQFAQIHYDDERRAMAPFGWSSIYYPTWLPEGISIKDITLQKGNQIIWYEDEKGNAISFEVLEKMSENNSTWFDQENMTQQEVNVKGYRAVLYTALDGREHTLLLVLDDAMLQIAGTLSESQVLRMAESIHGL